MVKNPLAGAGDLGDTDSIPELGRSPEGRQALQSTPVFLPGEPLRQRSLVGHSPQHRTEQDPTEAT